MSTVASKAPEVQPNVARLLQSKGYVSTLVEQYCLHSGYSNATSTGELLQLTGSYRGSIRPHQGLIGHFKALLSPSMRLIKALKGPEGPLMGLMKPL